MVEYRLKLSESLFECLAIGCRDFDSQSGNPANLVRMIVFLTISQNLSDLQIRDLEKECQNK